MDQMTQTILMLVAMFALMYFLMIRPENKRKKQAEEMRNSLKKGDTITTIGGIIGKVVRVTDETLVIETSEDRVRIEFAKWALNTNATQQEAAAAAAPAKKGKKVEEPAAEETAVAEEAPAVEEAAQAEEK